MNEEMTAEKRLARIAELEKLIAMSDPPIVPVTFKDIMPTEEEVAEAKIERATEAFSLPVIVDTPTEQVLDSNNIQAPPAISALPRRRGRPPGSLNKTSEPSPLEAPKTKETSFAFSLGKSDTVTEHTSIIERDIYNYVSKAYKGTDRPIILYGPTGSGKTFLAAQLARDQSKELVRIPFDDTVSMRELQGEYNLMAPDKSTITQWVDGVLTSSIQKDCIILLDDMSGMSANKMFVAHQLADSRKMFVKNLGTINMHEGCRLIGSMNPHTSAYSGTHKLDASLINRFICIEVPQFKKSELESIIPDSKHKAKLIEFYLKVNDAIDKESLDFEFSIRNMSYITQMLNAGLSLSKALHSGFMNSVFLTADKDQYNFVLNIAIGSFGVSVGRD